MRLILSIRAIKLTKLEIVALIVIAVGVVGVCLSFAFNPMFSNQPPGPGYLRTARLLNFTLFASFVLTLAGILICTCSITFRKRKRSRRLLTMGIGFGSKKSKGPELRGRKQTGPRDPWGDDEQVD